MSGKGIDMANNKMLSNVRDLTTAVGQLQQKIDALYNSLDKVSGKATEALGGAQEVLQSGGQMGVGQGSTTMNLGSDSARFPTSQPSSGGKMMPSSLGNFSFTWQFKPSSPEMALMSGTVDTVASGGGPGGGGGGGGGGSFASTVLNRGFSAGIAGGKMALGAFAAQYGMTPDLALTAQRSIGLEQALRLGTGSRQMLNQQLTGGLRNAMSSVGSDAIAAPILASRGFMPGTANYQMMVGETAGAFRYLGIDNAAAASALASLRSAPTGAALYNLGINTYNAETGKFKSTGQIAKELMNTLTAGRGATPEQIAFALQSGTLSGTLTDIFGTGAERDIMQVAMMDIAKGKNPDLAMRGEKDPIAALAAAGEANYSQTRLMQSAEGPMIEGFANAASYISAFNAELEKTIGPMAKLRGLISGIGGTNVGEGIATGAPLIASGLKDLVTLSSGLGKKGFAALLPIMTALAGVGASATQEAVQGATGVNNMPNPGNPNQKPFSLIPDWVYSLLPGIDKPSGKDSTGGGSSGYGASFNAQRLGGKGGSGVPQGMITAMYGAQNNDLWSSSGGKHTGTDIAMPIGSPVEAAMDGTVSSTNAGADYGMSVVLDHGNGYQTVYGHLSERLVNLGDKVSKGQKIAKSGDSGNSTGPHLHYEVRFGQNNPVDPSSLNTAFTANATSSIVLEKMGNKLSGYMGANATATGNYAGIRGTGDQRTWASQLLGALGAPTTSSNISALVTWAKLEGGHWNNSASYNPLNTTFDMGGNKSINSVGVKKYGSWEEGLNATVKTLLGNRSSERGYAAIVDALRNNAGTSSVLSAVNQSAWVHGEGKASNYNFPRGGGGPASMTTMDSGAKTVNITVTFNQADETSAMKFAKRVQHYLDRENNNSLIGSN